MVVEVSLIEPKTASFKQRERRKEAQRAKHIGNTKLWPSTAGNTILLVTPPPCRTDPGGFESLTFVTTC